MSDYGSRGHGSGPDDYGWPGNDGGNRHGSGPQGYGGRDSGGYGSGPSDPQGYGSRDSGGYGGDSGSQGYGGRDSGGYGGDSGSRGYGRGDDDHYSSDRYSGSSGSASVGSASVGGYSAHDEPPTTGRAKVPGADSTGPGRARGSARVGGKRRSGAELTEEEAAALKKAKKKKRRRRRLIALGCVMVVFLGTITVVGSLFFQSVPLPKDIIENELAQNTTVTFSDGSPMAKLGSEESNRVNVTYEEVPKEVVFALVAGEDANFFKHSGVDFWGVMRALWNNVTGGDTQGASTLTQQYVGQVMKIRGDDSYLRKANEAVMAMKMDDEYSKEKIIEYYLNLVYMGRGAYGLGAAVKAWYGEDQKLEDLTASQAALIFAQVKSPNGAYDPRNPCEPCGLSEEQAVANAKDRWSYFLKAQYEMGELSKAKYDEYTAAGLPETAETTSVSASEGFKDDTGFVSHRYVFDEAAEKAGLSEQDLLTGGYTITTTINKKAQDAAVEAARAGKKGEIMKRYSKNMRAALVSIDPATGRVVAYFGGTTNGSGTDKAGKDSPHWPGSSFKEFTMIAALEKGMSIESVWDGTSPKKFPTREKDVVNSGNTNEPRITMIDTVRRSLNTPIYAMTDKVGASYVADVARRMGITQLTLSDGTKVNLNEEGAYSLEEGDERKVFDNEIGFGQYQVSVFDMAVANATLSAGGVYREPHFIKEIKNKAGEVVYSDETSGKLEEDIAIPEGVAKDATFVASDIQPAEMGDGTTVGPGQPVAGKTGTWERTCEGGGICGENASTWYAGFTPKLSAAVWVGDKKDENGTVTDENGNPAYGSGPSGSVWLNYMNKATKIKGFDEVTQFPEPVRGGDKNAGNAKEEAPGDDENSGDYCERHPNKPRCNEDDDDDNQPNPNQCQPGSVGVYPDCDGNGYCDVGTPGCQEPNQECPNPSDPTDPDCGISTGDGGNDGGQPRVSPYHASYPAQLSEKDSYAIREDYALLT